MKPIQSTTQFGSQHEETMSGTAFFGSLNVKRVTNLLTNVKLNI